jgi:hypothetical protein
MPIAPLLCPPQLQYPKDKQIFQVPLALTQKHK